MPLAAFATEDEARASLPALAARPRTSSPPELKKRAAMVWRLGCLISLLASPILTLPVPRVGKGLPKGSALAGVAGVALAAAIVGGVGALARWAGRARRVWLRGTPVVATVTRIHKAPALVAPSEIKWSYTTAAGA